jgi:hypothetical protein
MYGESGVVAFNGATTSRIVSFTDGAAGAGAAAVVKSPIVEKCCTGAFTESVAGSGVVGSTTQPFPSVVAIVTLFRINRSHEAWSSRNTTVAGWSNVVPSGKKTEA